jgi:glycosyltransferase involved in cell wall biosynthesis
MARICIVTSGHLATCPRMLKAADAIAGAGYRVRVVSTRYIDWAAEADVDVRRRRQGQWEWTVVDYGRWSARGRHLRTGVRFRIARELAAFVGPARCPLALTERAFSRAHGELLRAALSWPADLFYGGTSGALAAVARAACRAGVPYALDLEDFHTAEQEDGASARLAHALAERIERAVLPGAAFVTAASEAIAAAYRAKYGADPIVVNNTQPLPAKAPDLAPTPGEGLRLYWFSQTIGPGRGLEDATRAMGLADIPGELHVRGRALPGYLEGLQRLADEVAPRLKVLHHEPAAPDAMVDLCRGYDVGLALEQAHVLNRALCLTNKAFTYMPAGLAVVLTDTPGQRPLASDMGEGAILYAPGDVRALAGALKRWAEDKPLLVRARGASWQAGQRRWHWEHPSERGALLGAVARALTR